MRPGRVARARGLRVSGCTSIGDAPGPNYMAPGGPRCSVTREGEEVALLLPERRHYPVQDTWTTEAAIHTTWLADLYVVVGEDAPAGGTAIRVHHNPLVPWIWLGAL